MNLWRLEWLRMVRTRRILALIGVWAFFGLLGPLTARYLAEIVERVGGGIVVTLPEAVPADGITQFMSNGLQLGLLAVVFVAAAALTLDANPEMSMFLRTRVDAISRLLTPRYVVVTLTAVAAFVCGLVLAAYETWALLGGLPADRIVVGGLFFVFYLAFAVALVAGVAGWLPSVVTTAAVSVGILLLLALTGLVESVGTWFPSHLAGAPDAMVRGAAASDYIGASAATLVAIPLLIWVGLKGFERREL